MFHSLILFTVLSSTQPLHPPFRIAWDTGNVGSLVSVDTQRNVIVTQDSGGEVDVIDLRNGKTLWSRPTGSWNERGTVHQEGSNLMIRLSSGEYLTYEIRSGKLLHKERRAAIKDYLLQKGDLVFVEDPHGVLKALDDRTEIVRWQYKVPGQRDPEKHTIPWGLFEKEGRLFFGIYPTGTICLNAKTGRQLWFKQSSKYMTFEAMGGQILGTWPDHGVIDPATGETIWSTLDEKFHCLSVRENQVMALVGSNDLACLDVNTGKVLWQKTILRSSSQWSSVITPERGVMALKGTTVSLYDVNGGFRWTFPLGVEINRIVTVLPDGFLIDYGKGLAKYVTGEPTPLPSSPQERKAVATKIASHVETMTLEERRLMLALGDDGFEALLDILRECIAGKDRLMGDRQDAYRLLMQEMTRKKHTQSLIDLLHQAMKEPKADDYSWIIVQLLERFGDDRLTVPIFLGVLKKEPEWALLSVADQMALRYVAKSSEPQAVAYMMDLLKDPQAPVEKRRTAYTSLAGTGSQAGLDAVLALRDTNRKMPPLDVLIGTDKIPQNGSGNQREVQSTSERRVRWEVGTAWIWFSRDVLGSRGDLWLAHLDGPRWIDPVYTGIDLDVAIRQIEPAKQKIFGQPYQEFLKEGWTKLLPKLADLSRDSDHDGLSDLIEQRLGTNPFMKDTDGDGIPDVEDRNPLAARQATTDEEKVIAASFEARFKFSKTTAPAVVRLPTGMSPFELYGNEGYIVALSSKADHPLYKLFGSGATYVSFFEPNGKAIQYSADGKQATVQMNVGFGGLNGGLFRITLQKFSVNWVVVGIAQQGSA